MTPAQTRFDEISRAMAKAAQSKGTVGKPGYTYERQYGEAYKAMVKEGTAPKLKRKYTVPRILTAKTR